MMVEHQYYPVVIALLRLQALRRVYGETGPLERTGVLSEADSEINEGDRVGMTWICAKSRKDRGIS